MSRLSSLCGCCSLVPMDVAGCSLTYSSLDESTICKGKKKGEEERGEEETVLLLSIQHVKAVLCVRTYVRKSTGPRVLYAQTVHITHVHPSALHYNNTGLLHNELPSGGCQWLLTH